MNMDTGAFHSQFYSVSQGKIQPVIEKYHLYSFAALVCQQPRILEAAFCCSSREAQKRKFVIRGVVNSPT